MSYSLLFRAIQEKKQVTGFYDGRYREFCPHVLGAKENAGSHVLVYQFGGSSRKGPVYGQWKCMVVSKLSGVSLRDGPWHTDASKFREQTQRCIDTIAAQVTY